MIVPPWRSWHYHGGHHVLGGSDGAGGDGRGGMGGCGWLRLRFGIIPGGGGTSTYSFGQAFIEVRGAYPDTVLAAVTTNALRGVPGPDRYHRTRLAW